MEKIKRNKYLIFLKDIFILSLTAFGGPQAHFLLFREKLVQKRNYLSEEELIELISFCQILPGPASTQTLVSIGFRIGGPNLAFLTLLIWIFPSCLLMTLAALAVHTFEVSSMDVHYLQFLQPVAVGFVFFAAYKIAEISVSNIKSYIIFIVSTVFCFFISTPAIFPIILIIGGLFHTLGAKRAYNIPPAPKEKLIVEWNNLLLYALIFIGAALLGKITSSLPIRLFENFFRNGSLIFGGGDTLSAMFYKEFVLYKHYLTTEEFLTGFSFQKILPGPLFAYASFIGGLSMRHYNEFGIVLGGLIAAIGIFLPGTIMIFFVLRFWDRLKKYPMVKIFLSGVNAASSGVVLATALVLFWPFMDYTMNIAISYILVTIVTVLLLSFTKIPPPALILLALILGFIF